MSVTAAEHRLGLGTLDREQAHVVRDVLEADVGAALLVDDVLPVLRDVGGVHHDHQLVVEAVHGAVVDEGALGRRGAPSTARRPAASAPTSLQVIRLTKAFRSGPVTSNSPMCETSKMPAVGAHRLVLGHDAGGILHRHLPSGERHHLGAEGDVDVVERGALERRVMVVTRVDEITRAHRAAPAFPSASPSAPSARAGGSRPRPTPATAGLRAPPRVTSSPRCAGRQWRKIADGVGARHERLRPPWIARERLRRSSLLRLLAHRRPDVGGHDVRAPRPPRPGRRVSATAGRAARPGEERRIGVVAFRAGEPQLEAERRRGVDPAVAPCCCRRRSRPTDSP